MVSRRLSGWGTARSTSYQRLDGSGCDRECAPRSTRTFPSALGAGLGSQPRPRRPAPPRRAPPRPAAPAAPAAHTSSRQCAALSTQRSDTRKPPHTCLPSTCTDAM